MEFLNYIYYISIVNHIILPRLYSTVFSAPSESTDHDGTNGLTDDGTDNGRIQEKLHFIPTSELLSFSPSYVVLLPAHFLFKASQVARYILHIYLAPLLLNPDGQ